MITNDKQQRNLKFIGEYTGELCWRCAFSQVALRDGQAIMLCRLYQNTRSSMYRICTKYYNKYIMCNNITNLSGAIYEFNFIKHIPSQTRVWIWISWRPLLFTSRELRQAPNFLTDERTNGVCALCTIVHAHPR